MKRALGAAVVVAALFFAHRALRPPPLREGVPFSLHQLVLHPPARFLRSYVLRRGFQDGLPGFVIGVASAFYVFLKYAKLWERTRRGDGEGEAARRLPPAA